VGELGIFARLVWARIRGELQYRTSFVAFVSASALVTFLDCVAILALFGRIDRLGGWDRSQVLFLYATSVLAFGLADLVVAGVEYTNVYVLDGGFDRMLVRPLGVMTQLLGHEFALRRCGRLVQATIVLGLVLANGGLAVEWTVARVGFAWFALLGAAVMFGALFVLTNTPAFWIPGIKEVANAFTYGGSTVAEYPTHVFGGWLRHFFMWVVPAGVVIYVPAIWILGAENPLDIPVWAQLASPLICIPVVIVAGAVWRLGLRRYESAGS
jgi:ABC-2 type transport system permease protein